MISYKITTNNSFLFRIDPEQNEKLTIKARKKIILNYFSVKQIEKIN